MQFNKIKIKKYGIKIGLFILGVYLTSLLAPLFSDLNNYLFEKMKVRIPVFINKIILVFNFKIPIYSLLMGIIFVWLIYNTYRKIKLGSNKLRILKATYGKSGHFIDITKELNNAVENNSLKIVLSNNIAGDPYKGIVKEGVIKYKLNGKIYEKKYKENDLVEIPKNLNEIKNK